MAHPGAEHVRLRPDLIYGNLGPRMSFIDTTPGYSINNYGPTFDSNQAVSQEFTATKNFSFADAKIAIQGIPGATLNVILQGDANGQPGNVLEEIPVTITGPEPQIITANSALHPALVRGENYWLTLTMQTQPSLAWWEFNSTGDVSAQAGTLSGSAVGPWSVGSGQTRGAFEIDGTPGLGHSHLFG